MTAEQLPGLATPKPVWTAKALLDRLERHYIPESKSAGQQPGGVFAREVGLNGQTAQRRCDAVYIGFTSSSGRLMVGHEVKVSRGDWLAELGKPGKADSWADACHVWYVVAPDVEVVKPSELPHGWGLMVPDSRAKVRFKIAVRAQPKPDGHHPSWLHIRSVLARLDTLRQGRETALAQELQQEAWERAQKATEAAAARSAGLTRDEQLARDIVKAVQGSGHGYIYVRDSDVELVAQAILDAKQVRDETLELARQLVQHARGMHWLEQTKQTALDTAAKLEQLAQ